MKVSTKGRKKGVLESMRVLKDKLGWSCLATGKRKEMMTLTLDFWIQNTVIVVIVPWSGTVITPHLFI